jgi:outer membrane biosynthesis protein TonB
MQPTDTTAALKNGFWLVFTCGALLCGCESHAPQPMITMDKNHSAPAPNPLPPLTIRRVTPSMVVKSNVLHAPSSCVLGTSVNDLAKSNPPAAKYIGQLIKAVEERWYNLLDDRNYSGEATGEAVLTFQLHPDGSVSDVCIATNTVDLALVKVAESAIKDARPFAKWPDEMRSKVGSDVIKVSFIFHY